MSKNQRNFIHGHSTAHKTSRTYYSWAAMKARCANPKKPNYKWYGGRGIKVCERWEKSFKAFLEDMGERPNGTTIDRWPNNDGNYEPGNCRWATYQQQRDNQRRTISIQNKYIPPVSPIWLFICNQQIALALSR